MAYIKRKRIKGRDYYYLVRTYRQGGKVKTQTLRYLGTRRPDRGDERTLREQNAASGTQQSFGLE